MIKESVRYGWDKMKENTQLSILSTLLMLTVGVVSGGGKGFFKSLLGILAAIFLIIIKIGYRKIFLRMSDGDKPKFSDIFKEYHLFWKFLGVSILLPLIVFAGLLLLIIPGVIWAVRFSFSAFILVDTKVGPIAAMKESWAITQNSFWRLLGFWAVIVLINMVGVLAVGIGLLFTIPVTTFAAVKVYRELSKSKAGMTVKTTVTPVA